MKAIKRKHINEKERIRIIIELKKLLNQESFVIFAYTYGSFNKGNHFNDIDVAVYVDETYFPDQDQIFQYQISLAAKAELFIDGYEIDLRVINLATLSFKFNIVTSGKLIFFRDRNKLIQFVTRTRKLYFDFQPYRNFFYQKIVLGK